MGLVKKIAIVAGAALACPTAANAQDTITYSYDALGRLVATRQSGSVNNGQADSFCYDRAGNRRVTQSSGSGSLASCPTLPPANQPPIANPNSLSAPKCVQRSVNVVANDTDPENHLPLTLIAVDQPWATVESAINIGLTTPDTNGTYVITYTITDVLGATANGTLTVTVTGNQQCV